jgi:hypothetical protein
VKWRDCTGLAVVGSFIAISGLAAGNWDGTWSGPVEPENSKKCDRGNYDLTIVDSKISGKLLMANPGGNEIRSDVTGTVDPTGTATLVVSAVTAHARHSRFTVKYADGKFTGRGNGTPCSFTVELTKQG